MFIALADAHAGEVLELILTVALADALCVAFAVWVHGGVGGLIAELAWPFVFVLLVLF